MDIVAGQAPIVGVEGPVGVHAAGKGVVGNGKDAEEDTNVRRLLVELINVANTLSLWSGVNLSGQLV